MWIFNLGQRIPDFISRLFAKNSKNYIFVIIVKAT